ncbi:hypothetical protein [Larkinella rosea]|uniref:Uncharacterized protein n=1 Tax=Larkinella rosea TaxID=2025312 RepID=A0A3P1BP73_9BACT|nr:hypothetical protein [Larkinella rosea]RRB02848.1 hypothetical protein EHT25_20640 [Larkinella rosea]
MKDENEAIRNQIEQKLMHYKTYIPSFTLKELYTVIPASETVLNEEIYWYLVENEYFSIGKLRGDSLKERLLSVDWRRNPTTLFQSIPPAPAPSESSKTMAKLTQRERRLLNVLGAIWAFILIFFLYWLWKHVPFTLFKP